MDFKKSRSLKKKICVCVVLDLQKHCKDSTVNSRILHSQFATLVTSWLVWYICSNYWTNIEIFSLNKVHTLFRFP